jgi:hypothetical protein
VEQRSNPFRLAVNENWDLKKAKVGQILDENVLVAMMRPTIPRYNTKLLVHHRLVIKH